MHIHYISMHNCISILSKFAFILSRSLAVGTRTGYKLYSLGSVDKLECIFESGKMCKMFKAISCNLWPEIGLTKWAAVSGCFKFLYRTIVHIFHVLELEIRQMRIFLT